MFVRLNIYRISYWWRLCLFLSCYRFVCYIFGPKEVHLRSCLLTSIYLVRKVVTLSDMHVSSAYCYVIGHILVVSWRWKASSNLGVALLLKERVPQCELQIPFCCSLDLSTKISVRLPCYHTREPTNSHIDPSTQNKLSYTTGPAFGVQNCMAHWCIWPSVKIVDPSFLRTIKRPDGYDSPRKMGSERSE